MVVKLQMKGLRGAKVAELEQVAKTERKRINDQYTTPQEKADRYSVNTAKRLISFAASDGYQLEVGNSVLECENGDLAKDFYVLKDLLFNAQMEKDEVVLEARFIKKAQA